MILANISPYIFLYVSTAPHLNDLTQKMKLFYSSLLITQVLSKSIDTEYSKLLILNLKIYMKM